MHLKNLTLLITLLFSCNLHAQVFDIDHIKELNKEYKYITSLKLCDSLLRNPSKMSVAEELEISTYKIDAFVKLEKSGIAEKFVERFIDLYKRLDKSTSNNRDIAYAALHRLSVLYNADYEFKKTYAEVPELMALIPSHSEPHPQEIYVYEKLLESEMRLSKIKEGKIRLDSIKSKYKRLTPEQQNELLFTLYNTQGRYYHNKQETDKAISFYEKASKEALKQNNYRNLFQCHSNIGVCYFFQRQYEKSKYNLEKAKNYIIKYTDIDDKSMISINNNLGVINMKLEKYDVAEAYYTTTKELILKYRGERNRNMGRILFNIAMSKYQKGNLAEALNDFTKSYEIRLEVLGDEHSDVSHTQQMIGVCYHNMDELTKAKKWYEKALGTLTKIQDDSHPEALRLLSDLTKVNIIQGDYTTAENLIDRQFNAQGYNPAAPYAFDRLNQISLFAYPLIDKMSYQVKQYEASQDQQHLDAFYKTSTVFDSLQNYQKKIFFGKDTRRLVLADYEKKMNLILKLHTLPYFEDHNYGDIYQLFEQSNNRFLYETIAERGDNAVFGVPKAILETKKALIDSITLVNLDINQSKIEDTDKGRPLLDKKIKFESELLSIDEKIKKEYPQYYNNVVNFPITSYRQTKEDMDENTEIVYYFYMDNVYAYKFSTTQDIVLNLGSNTEIENDLSTLQNLISSKGELDEIDDLSKKVYTFLIAPLNLQNESNVIIIPHGKLSHLSFESLINPESNQYFLEEHATTYRYSNSLVNPSNNFNTKKILAMAPFAGGDSSNQIALLTKDSSDVYRNDLVPLNYSADEINYIQSLWNSKVMIQNSGSEQEFKDYAGDAAVIHLATHAFSNPSNRDNSRIYFNPANDTINDGLLYTSEIMTTYLKPQLLTLSACNSGQGTVLKGEGVASIGRAFANSGCQNQVLTLWPVSDKSTSEIMKNFYQNMYNDQNKFEALRNAKLAYLENSPKYMKHPFYWAGFVYFGDQAPLVIDESKNWKWWALIISLAVILLLFLRSRSRKSV